MTYAMFSDDALSKFRTFCSAAGFTKPPHPAGAFDSALKHKGNKTPYRFVPVPHCGNKLFFREKSSDLAFDEATEITTFAKEILNFLRGKISDEDLNQVEESLKMEAGVKTDNQKDAEAMISGAKARGAQDAKRRQLALDASAAASTARQADFAARFPGAARVGQV